MWWIMAVGAASAAEPTIEMLDGGKVRGVIEVPAQTSVVRALVEKPVELAKVTAADATITSEPAAQPGCRKVTTHSPHPIMAVTYVSRDCNTDRGVTSQLVESKQLSEFEAVWSLEAKGEHTVVTYDLDIKTNLPLPGFIVRRSTRRAVVDALTALEQSFAQ